MGAANTASGWLQVNLFLSEKRGGLTFTFTSINQLLFMSRLAVALLETKRKGSPGSDDTASMIKGGGYIGARTRQPPHSANN